MLHLRTFIILCCIGTSQILSVYAEPYMPEPYTPAPTDIIPDDIARLVTWTHLCENWMKSINNNQQSTIDSTPALIWAEENCAYEELEKQVIDLQSKYKSAPIPLYMLNNLLGTYKD